MIKKEKGRWSSLVKNYVTLHAWGGSKPKSNKGRIGGKALFSS